MEGKGKRSLPLNLPLPRKEDVIGSPRFSYEPGSSHRHSLASTGVGDPSSPFLRSPELTYVSSTLPSPKVVTAGATLPPPLSARELPGKEVLRHGVLITPRQVEETPTGLLMTPAIINAKAQGRPLPPLKESNISMLDEGISPYTANMIDGIPKEEMLRMAGPSMHTHDPRFTEDVKQYHLEHPIPPNVLKKYPNYEKFPLLLSRIHRPTLEPNVKETKHFEHLRGHNEAMLENKWQQERVGLPLRETYMHVPNFGRVQAILTDFPDGTSYPLVTLPKMTPYDILCVLDKQQKAKERSWLNALLRCLQKVFCGLF